MDEGRYLVDGVGGGMGGHLGGNLVDIIGGSGAVVGGAGAGVRPHLGIGGAGDAGGGVHQGVSLGRGVCRGVSGYLNDNVCGGEDMDMCKGGAKKGT